LTLSDIQLGILGIIDVESTYNNIILIKFIISQNKVKHKGSQSQQSWIFKRTTQNAISHRNPL